MGSKSTYYVSVQAGSVLKERGAAAYEFEIVADDQEADALLELLEEKEDADDATFIRAHLPATPTHLDSENDMYDYFLLAAYRKIHELGTPETKAAIERMNVLNEEELG